MSSSVTIKTPFGHPTPLFIFEAAHLQGKVCQGAELVALSRGAIYKTTAAVDILFRKSDETEDDLFNVNDTVPKGCRMWLDRTTPISARKDLSEEEQSTYFVKQPQNQQTFPKVEHVAYHVNAEDGLSLSDPLCKEFLGYIQEVTAKRFPSSTAANRVVSLDQPPFFRATVDSSDSD